MGSVGVGSHDDLALLAVNISPPGEALDLELSPQPESLTSMRQAVGRWLRAAEAGEDEIYEMLVASGEAWSNAVAHAHPATSDEPFRLRALRRGAEIEITVSDTGQWRPPAPETRQGRGLALIGELMDDMEVYSGPEGTTVTMRRRLRERVTRGGDS